MIEINLDKSDVIDLKSFEQLFLRLYPVMCGVADHYLNNEILSKDIAQEAFIKLWEKRSELTNILAVKSYLYMTIRNLSLNYIRDHYVKSVKLGTFADPIVTDEVENDLIEEEVIYLLYNAIDQLPSQSSKIILMSLNGLKNTEIAEKLGISVNSVKTLKYNALKRLQKELKDIYPLLLFLLSTHT